MIKTGKYFSWTIASEIEAVKLCDKSFFQYQETGIPHAIGWFFDADTLSPGESKEVTLLFQEMEHNAVLNNSITDRYRISWGASLGKQFEAYNNPDSYPIITFQKISDNYYAISFRTDFVSKDDDSHKHDVGKLVNVINQFVSYIISRDVTVNFQDRNSFLGREENYKSIAAVKAQEALQYENWKPEYIDNGKILAYANLAMNCAGNLVNKHQQITFKNLIASENRDIQLKVGQALYNIYKSKGEIEERQAFDEAISVFGGKYDTIAYLFFIKDSSRFLPVSTRHFEKSLKSVGISYKLSGQCSWDNYVGFIEIVRDIQDVMVQMLPDVEIRLIDVHSFLWVIGEDGRPTDFLNWHPDEETEEYIENETEKWLEEKAEGKVQRRRHSASYYTRNNEVSRITKTRAKGICELCGKPAPFNDNSGTPYLETHHIVWLSRNGKDSTDNTVALCPNCHKRMHVLDDEKDIALLQQLRLK